MKRLLVTGANGFVGRALCNEAIARDIKIRCATRHPCKFPEGIESVSLGDINGQTDWQHALEDVDVVIHLAARVHVMHDVADNPLAEFRSTNLEGAVRLARQAAQSGAKRLVYVSSIKVNGEETPLGIPFTEAAPAMPADPYGVSKWEAEQALNQIARETGLEIVIVRPPLVYGPQVKGNFVQMLKVIWKGIPLPLGSVKNRRDLLYVGNLVDALLLCADHASAAGRTYLLSDGESISTAALLRKLAGGLGKQARVFPFPVSLLKLAGALLGRSAQVKRLLGSLQVDNAKIRSELNWVPPYTLQQGLQTTAEWYRNLKRRT